MCVCILNCLTVDIAGIWLHTKTVGLVIVERPPSIELAMSNLHNIFYYLFDLLLLFHIIFLSLFYI